MWEINQYNTKLDYASRELSVTDSSLFLTLLGSEYKKRGSR